MPSKFLLTNCVISCCLSFSLTFLKLHNHNLNICTQDVYIKEMTLLFFGKYQITKTFYSYREHFSNDPKAPGIYKGLFDFNSQKKRGREKNKPKQVVQVVQIALSLELSLSISI